MGAGRRPGANDVTAWPVVSIHRSPLTGVWMAGQKYEVSDQPVPPGRKSGGHRGKAYVGGSREGSVDGGPKGSGEGSRGRMVELVGAEPVDKDEYVRSRFGDFGRYVRVEPGGGG